MEKEREAEEMKKKEEEMKQREEQLREKERQLMELGNHPLSLFLPQNKIEIDKQKKKTTTNQ